MKNQSIWGSALLKVIAVLMVLIAVTAIWYGVFSVTTKITEDSLRGTIVATSYVLGLAFFARWIFYAVQNKDRDLFLFSSVITLLYLAVGGGMLWLNGQINTNTLKESDYRITWVMQNVVWIPAVLTGLLTYLMMVYNKHQGGKKPPMDITVLEGVVILFAVIGSAWGTIDAYIGLTHDVSGAVWLAGVTELALLGFIVWSLRANDKYSFWFATVASIAYFGIAMSFQLLDGGIRAGNLDNNADLQQFATNLVWVMPVITVGLGIALAVVDAAVNGSSWLKGTPMNAKPELLDKPTEIRVERPNRPMRPMGGQIPAHSGHGQSQTKFAEPGGLEKKDVIALKALGYSNRAIEKMKDPEAKSRIANKVPPAPNQRSGNYQPPTNSKTSPNPNPVSTDTESDDEDVGQVEQTFDQHYVKFKNGNGQNPTQPS